ISCSTLLASFHHPTPAPICTLSLHDALPISSVWDPVAGVFGAAPMIFGTLASSLVALLLAVPLALGVAIYLTEFAPKWLRQPVRSEEHTSELQSRFDLVCRLLLEKKNKGMIY